MNPRAIRIGSALLAAALGCAPKLEPHREDGRDAATAEDQGTVEKSGAFTHRVRDDGVVITVVDSTDSEQWHYLDLDSRRDDSGAKRWDLGFSRFRVRTNGGASGDGGVRVAALDGRDFDSLQRAPDAHAGYAADRPDSADDTDSEPDNAFNSGPVDWYDYNVMNHTLSPRAVVYVIASTAARFYKMKIENYYDRNGTPGFLEFRWSEIAAPSGGLPESDQDGGAEKEP